MLIVGAAASATRSPSGNEVLKEFQLKLTPMAIAKCLRYYRNPI
ncbi:MAG: hypothetical protein V7L11_25060 [Nostoc sp.]